MCNSVLPQFKYAITYFSIATLKVNIGNQNYNYKTP